MLNASYRDLDLMYLDFSIFSRSARSSHEYSKNRGTWPPKIIQPPPSTSPFLALPTELHLQTLNHLSFNNDQLNLAILHR